MVWIQSPPVIQYPPPLHLQSYLDFIDNDTLALTYAASGYEISPLNTQRYFVSQIPKIMIIRAPAQMETILLKRERWTLC